MEKFEAAIQIMNAPIDVASIESEFTNGSDAYTSFRKITGPEEVGERLDDVIEILLEIVTEIREIKANTNSLLAITTKGFADLNGK